MWDCSFLRYMKGTIRYMTCKFQDQKLSGYFGWKVVQAMLVLLFSAVMDYKMICFVTSAILLKDEKLFELDAMT